MLKFCLEYHSITSDQQKICSVPLPHATSGSNLSHENKTASDQCTIKVCSLALFPFSFQFDRNFRFASICNFASVTGHLWKWSSISGKKMFVILNSGLIFILKSCFLIKIFDRWWIRECGTNTVKLSFIWSACAHILVINGRLVAQWHIWQCCPWVATSRSYWSSLQCQWYTYSVA